MAVPTQAITLPALSGATEARPQLTPPVMMKLSPAPSSARPRSRMARDTVGSAAKAKVKQAGDGGRQQTGHDAPLRAIGVGKLPRPDAREERNGELAAGHEADSKRAETEILVHVQGKHRQGQPDGQESGEHRGHDRQQDDHDRRAAGDTLGTTK
jgi:hypothetical protein